MDVPMSDKSTYFALHDLKKVVLGPFYGYTTQLLYLYIIECKKKRKNLIRLYFIFWRLFYKLQHTRHWFYLFSYTIIIGIL